PTSSAVIAIGSPSRSHATPVLLFSMLNGEVCSMFTCCASTSAPTADSALLTAPDGSTSGGLPPLQIYPAGLARQASLAVVHTASSTGAHIASLTSVPVVSCAAVMGSSAAVVNRNKQSPANKMYGRTCSPGKALQACG